MPTKQPAIRAVDLADVLAYLVVLTLTRAALRRVLTTTGNGAKLGSFVQHGSH